MKSSLTHVKAALSRHFSVGLQLRAMRRPAAAAVAIACLSCLVTACGGADETAAQRTPQPAPEVTLTPEEQDVWAPLPANRDEIPVLLYHGIGPEGDFANEDDAAYGVGFEDFAKQMTMIAQAGYQTIDLETYVDFVGGEPVELPPRPLLLTFDDARADSWTGADGILDELGFNAVMFVDVGRVEDGDPEYLTWDELDTARESGRWELQLHSGEGHQQIRYGPGENDFGPYYAYKKEGEDFAGWQERVRSDIEWGQETLADHVQDYEPKAFAVPYGNYGQEGTNDERIPGDLLGWLTDRFGTVFTQDVNALARVGSGQPLGRIQVARATTGGDLHARLLSGENG
jgi:peptidoglycan/xylan/chitin deacetylase (PgdA/CDA1 family)